MIISHIKVLIFLDSFAVTYVTTIDHLRCRLGHLELQAYTLFFSCIKSFCYRRLEARFCDITFLTRTEFFPRRGGINWEKWSDGHCEYYSRLQKMSIFILTLLTRLELKANIALKKQVYIIMPLTSRKELEKIVITHVVFLASRLWCRCVSLPCFWCLHLMPESVLSVFTLWGVHYTT